MSDLANKAAARALAASAAAGEEQRAALEAMKLGGGRNAMGAGFALQAMDAANPPGASSIAQPSAAAGSAAAASPPAGELYIHTARAESEEERAARLEEHAIAMQQQQQQRAEVLSSDERSSLALLLAQQLTPQLFDGGRTPTTNERSRLRAQDELCSNLALYHTVAPEAMRLIDEWFAQHPDVHPDRRLIAIEAFLSSARAPYQRASLTEQLNLGWLAAAVLDVLPKPS